MGSETAVRAAGKRELQRIVDGAGVRVVHADVRADGWSGPWQMTRVTSLDGVLARWVWWTTADEATVGEWVDTIEAVAERHARAAGFAAFTGGDGEDDVQEHVALAAAVALIRGVDDNSWLIGDWWAGP